MSAAPVLHTRAAHTNARAEFLVTPFMEWLLSIGQRATKYGERGRTARPLLTGAPRIINCSCVALLHPPRFYALEFRSLVAIW